MAGLAIPTAARERVRRREGGRCLLCRAGRASECHHRRSRGVRDEHTHCPCVLVYLCHTCHTWVTTHPAEAMRLGLIVSRHEPNPGSVTITTPWGTVRHDCNGESEQP